MQPHLTILTARALEEDARRAGERQARLLEAREASRPEAKDRAITLRQAQPRLRRWLRLSSADPLRPE
jgi:hypothetical protein